MKNHWGWAGFTTHDLKRCQIIARLIALVYNWWTLRAAGRSRPSPRRPDQPPSAAAGYRPPDPPCRPDPPDHHRQPRPPSPRGPAASPNCQVLQRPAPNCGAVDSRRTLAPNPQPSTYQVSHGRQLRRPPWLPAGRDTYLIRMAKVPIYGGSSRSQPSMSPLATTRPEAGRPFRHCPRSFTPWIAPQHVRVGAPRHLRVRPTNCFAAGTLSRPLQCPPPQCAEVENSWSHSLPSASRTSRNALRRSGSSDPGSLFT